MKKTFLIYLCMVFFLSVSCTTEQIIVIPENTISFRLLNFTDVSYSSATLFVGAIDETNNFKATDSIKYSYIPSNQSPNGFYTYLDNCTITCGNDGFVDGFHYFFSNGEYFVDIPFSPENNTWKPDLEKVLTISDDLAFLIKLSNGNQKQIGGFDLRKTILENPVPINALVNIAIKQVGINGKTTF